MRATWSESLLSLAHSLALYSATPLPDALSMTRSDVEDFFQGKAYGDWRKGKENELKIQVALGERLNSIIRACGVVVTAISRLGRRLP